MSDRQLIAKRRLSKNHVLAITAVIAGPFMFLSYILLSTTQVFAENCTTDSTTGQITCTSSVDASVNVSSACSMTRTINTAHDAVVPNGIYSGDSNYYPNGIGQTTIKTICNDGNGFSIYAIGYTGEVEGETRLVGTNSSSNIIATGTADSGNISNWAMKLATSAEATYPITINGGFNNYHAVPSEYTKVAYRESGTDVGASATGASLTTTYAAFVSNTQAADTYAGKVKYVLVHPEDGDAPTPTE